MAELLMQRDATFLLLHNTFPDQDQYSSGDPDHPEVQDWLHTHSHILMQQSKQPPSRVSAFAYLEVMTGSRVRSISTMDCTLSLRFVNTMTRPGASAAA